MIPLSDLTRTFARIGAPCLGLPVFNSDGKFVGIGINRFAPKSEDMDGGSTGATSAGGSLLFLARCS